MGAPAFALLIAAIGVLFVTGLVYQRVRMRLDFRQYAVPATLVRVNGSNLYIRVSGQSRGGVPA
ncbi:MAG: hypothetical protein ACRDHP_11670, partial [Ktedonobacterales bacterium]